MNNKMTYKRDKSKVEITGSAEQVKTAMWFDLLSYNLPRIIKSILLMIVLVILWASLPVSGWIPIVLTWLTKKWPLLIHLGGLEAFLLTLSG